MRQIDSHSQKLFASANLKKSNPEATEALDERLTPQEEALYAQYCDHNLILSVREAEEAEIRARVAASASGKFATKAKIRRAILSRFKTAFGAECFDLAIVGMNPELDFKMKWNGWIISTRFDFEVRGKQFDHGHTIHSESKMPPHDLPVILGFPGLTGWLGLRGDTRWEQLIDEDIQPVCDFIIQRCRIVFDILPKMLKGFEFESLTEG